MTDSESDGAGYLSEDIQESGFLDGPRDSAALAASGYTRMPHGVAMTPKIPPGFDGIMSWFEYEQLVDDWVALTTIEPARQGPSLKTRLTGLAEKYKELLDNNRLKDPEQGVEYFKKFLRPYFVKGVQHVYIYRFLQLFKTWRGQKGYVTWITDFEIMLKKVKRAWMDLLPTIDISNEQFTSVAQQEPAFQNAQSPADQYAVLEDLHARFTSRRNREHARLFPIEDNLLAQLFLVQADLSENQRERLISSMTLTGTRIDTYQYEQVKAQVFELFCTTRTGLADPRLRTSVQGQHRGFRSNRTTGGRSFAILDHGDFDGQFGYWVQDEDTLEEGFIAEEDEEDVFWQVDENEAFIARRFKRRPRLRRAGKGRRKRKRGRFKSHRKGSAHTAEGDDYNTSLYGKAKGKGKGKWKGGKEDADFAKGKGKGKNKGTGKGKPFAKGGKSFEAEGTTSQPSQAAAATAPSTEGWSWYTEEDWSSWEEGAYLATHHKNKRKRKPRRGKKEKKLCIPGRGTDGLVHSKPNEEQEVPKYIASASTKDVANTRSLSEISDYGAAHVVFTDHDTALAVQFATVNLNKNPNYVILDSGCTRTMGSRYAIERLQKYVEDHCPGKIIFTYSPSGTKFSFANSQSARITEKVTLWFDTSPPANTTIEVLDEGKVPILFSIQQMRNLRMSLEHTPTADYATCEAFGLNRTVLPVSTNNHLILDLLCFTRGPTYNMRDEEATSFRATMLNEATEVSKISEEALAGKGRPAKQEIKCRNCLGNPKAGHSWDKHCRLYIPGKSKFEMKSAFEKKKRLQPGRSA